MSIKLLTHLLLAFFLFGSLTVCALICNQHQHGALNEAHLTEIDVELGQFTKEQLKQFESVKPDSSLSSKTPPVQLDGGHTNDILTIVIDFKDSSQPITTDVFENEVGVFDVTEYGFDASDFSLVTQAIYDEVIDDFFSELSGTVANENGMELELNIIEGDIGTPPPGITEYYYVQVGTGLDGPFTFALGVAAGSSVRNSSGSGPNNDIEIGDVVASVFTDNIQGLSNIDPPDALSSGDLNFSRNAVVGTLSHEIGHVVSLSHINLDMSVQPTNGAAPIMGTGAIDLPSQLRLTDREFSLTGFNAQNGNTQVFQVQQLVDAIGLTSSINGPLQNVGLTFSSGVATGGLTELENEDQSAIEILADNPTKILDPIVFEVVAESTTLAPENISLEIVALANTPNINQTIEIFNFATNQFEVLNSSNLGLQFESTQTDLTINPADYVDQVNCQCRCRCSYSANGPVWFFPWQVDVDALTFQVNAQ